MDEKNEDTPEKHIILEKENIKLTSSLRKIFTGLFYSFLSGAFYAGSSVIVKHVNRLHPGQLALYRSIAIFTFPFPEIVKAKRNPFGPKDMRFLLFLRGVFSGSNMFLHFLAFRYLPLGEATVIFCSLPIFVTILAKIVLKEPCNFIEILTTILTVIGILLVTRVPEKLISSNIQYTNDTTYGLVAAFLSILFNSGIYILLRKLKTVHHSVTMFNFGWIAIIESSLLTFFMGNYNRHACGTEQWLMIMLGIFSYMGQKCITLALQCEFAGPVSTMRSAADIILAFIFQVVVFKDIPNGTSISGSVLVVLCSIVLGLKKLVIALPESSELRSKLKYLTF